MSRPQPSGPHSPGMMFQWLRWRRLRNTLRHILGQSIIRPLTIFLCSLLVWGFVFFVSYEGFTFMRLQRLPMSGGIIGVLFDLLFLTLSIMLVFSTGIILYSSLFNSAETAFLLSKPATADHIFAFKYQGAIAFSSWAFLLLGGPILIAYGIVVDAPWYYYVMLGPFVIAFVCICCTILF